MKKTFLFLFLTAFFHINFGQQKAHILTLENSDSFSYVLLPDVQNYVKYDYNQPILEFLTAWVADNIDNLNVKAVLCTGDLVDQNECLVPPFPRFGNQTSTQQWQFVSHAFKRLDHLVPYIISTGNHDYGYTRAETADTYFPEYFTVERNNKYRNCLTAVYNNRLGKPTLENAAYAFEDKHWGNLLVIAMEYGVRDEVLQWAKELCDSEEYCDHKVIVLVHSYMGAGNNAPLLKKDKYKLTPINGGEDIWKKLLFETKNIRLLICGHYAVPNEDFASNVGFRTDKNKVGKDVFQMMFNTQALGGGMSGNGGDGWLRVLEFMPDGKTVRVITYSPLFAFSPRTKHLAEDEASYNKFSFVIE
ncbi:MAG: serine/threonine protein phosphatase [Bacteroidales bacterium]|nr:serine/threonine protein phosphatase [Bacteroidales bacterium]